MSKLINRAIAGALVATLGLSAGMARPATAQAVVSSRADLGVAWDGDFDRCFFFDHRGAFVDGE